MWTLVEPCCGTASLTLHLLGARRSLVAYQGSKWRYRKELEIVARELEFRGPPSRVILQDVGPWPDTLKVVLDPKKRKELIRSMRRLASYDPKLIYGAFNGKAATSEPIARAAQHLFLQRLAFSSKAVGMKDGIWKSPGFNAGSAYGLEATAKFGGLNPMVPSLIRTLESYEALGPVKVLTRVGTAGGPKTLPGRLTGSTLTYIDPPYQDTTAYPDGELKRFEVIKLALQYKEAGAAVMVSEAEPVLDSWDAVEIDGRKTKGSSFKGKHAEWVTFCRGRK